MSDTDPPATPSITPAEREAIANVVHRTLEKRGVSIHLNGHAVKIGLPILAVIVGVPGYGLYRSEQATTQTGATVAEAVRENTRATRENKLEISDLRGDVLGAKQRIDDVAALSVQNARQLSAQGQLQAADTEAATVFDRARKVKPAAVKARVEAVKSERMVEELEEELSK